MSTIQSLEPELDSVLIAAQLARFCPTSLSFDNLNLSTFRDQKKKYKSKNNEEYIPPKPIEKNIKNNSDNNQNKASNSKFAFLLKSKKTETTQTISNKFVYELPNVKKVATPLKTNKSLMVISLSVGDLKSIDTPIIKGAKQVKSIDDDYSDDSDSYYSDSD